MSNAFKFTFKGYIRVGIDYDYPNSNILKFFIEDSGTGIPENIKTQLFTAYSTFDHHEGSNK